MRFSPINGIIRDLTHYLEADIVILGIANFYSEARMATLASWIEKHPEVCGGDACIRTTRHTVHGLVVWKKMGLTDARILEHHPDLTHADLEAAWDYYQHHLDEIDRAIKEDEEA